MKDSTIKEIQERTILIKKWLQDTKEEWNRKCKEANSKVDWNEVGNLLCGVQKEEDKRKGYVYCRKTKKYVKEN